MEETRRVRLRDVADRAGVSPTTASFVLGGRDMRISEETRQRVLRTARELDYRPNLMARSLRTQETRTIGLVADTIATGHYGGELIRGALTAALRHGYRLLVCESEGDPALEATLVEDLVGRQVNGLVLATTSHDRVTAPRNTAGLPVVLLNCRSDADLPSIVPDEEEGGRAAATLLVEAGHRDRIWMVGETPERSLPGSGRRRGVVACLAEVGVEVEREISCPWWPEGAFDELSSVLADGHRPGAIICLNDRIALGVTQALAAAGLVVPTDVSLVSFDDSELAAWLRPSLTSIALPEREMGRLAIESLLSPEPTPALQQVHMPVRVRDSIGPPPG
ncbi:LacI family DNA-binding transcriptional regulator [Nocardioides currus]|uniref:LacI family DNA-binding transcriptional regulator n=1 Tax=Nocardioides currus TaxID=2133958 RepID=UPI001A9C88F1|nr:LacI family DNA-binding transcriptional regulator [Nocardioides currus]